jgi:hypothetical protein
VEALAIVNPGAGNQVCHIARDQATDGGWRARSLFGGWSAEQVAAGVATRERPKKECRSP